MFKKVLITGANGQLARCIKHIANQHPAIEFVFVDKNQLDITHAEKLAAYFSQNTFTHLINTAAYTQVDAAEDQQDLAFKINEQGPKNLALACEKYGIELLQLSTDYVFDGTTQNPYTETSPTKPLNVYGASKLAGEKAVIANCKKHIILRTSWLYSPFGHNFYLSMKKAIQEQRSLHITTEQLGTPTNALRLAEVLLRILQQEEKEYGIYHYSDFGEATWYAFAMQIEYELLGENKGYIQAVDHYKTKANRPAYSVLNQDKIQRNFKIQSIPWQLALKEI